MKNANRAQWWEDVYPSVLSFLVNAAVIAFLFFNRGWVIPMRDGVVKLAPSVLNVSAIAVGFLATSEALLLTLNDSRVMKELRKGDHYTRLFTFFGRALATSFVTSVFSALLTAMHVDHGGAVRYVVVTCWSYFGVVANVLLCALQQDVVSSPGSKW